MDGGGSKRRDHSNRIITNRANTQNLKAHQGLKLSKFFDSIFASENVKTRSNDLELGFPELGLISCLEVVQNTE